MALPKKPLSNEEQKPQNIFGPTNIPKITQPSLPETNNNPNFNTPGRKLLNINDGVTTLRRDLTPEKLKDTTPKRKITSAQLSAKDVLTKDYQTHYKHLTPLVIQMRDWTQEHLTNGNKNDQISNARKQRGEAYQEMSSLIDNLLVKKFVRDAGVRPDDQPYVIQAVINEILGLGPIEPLWEDKTITEIMVNGPTDVKVEIKGEIIDAPGCQFRDAEHLLEVCQGILGDINRRVDVQKPTADGRLPDGSRINVVHQFVAPTGPLLTIRRFPDTAFTLKDVVEKESMTEEMVTFIGNLVHKGCSVLISGGTGSGKSLTLDTVIPTPSGKTTMGELKIGDVVLDENAEPTTVLGYYPQPLKNTYEIMFSDGTKIVAGEDHNWFTSTRVNNTETVVTTKQILDTLYTADGQANHAVRLLSKPVPYQKQTLKVDPYMFGATLDNNSQHDNPIPDTYLYSSVEQRYALIAGLLDKNGNVNKNNGFVEFTSLNKNVIDGFRQIVHSLGYQSTLSSFNNVNETGSEITTYIVSFFADDDVFTIEEKNVIHREIRVTKKDTHFSSVRYIVDVKLVESVPTACITVDSPNSLYLASDSFIVTHNTSMLNALSGVIPDNERVVTIEDNLELRLNSRKHVAAMEAKEAGASGDGGISIRSLVMNAMRMRPDRLIIGEVRDEAAYDMLQAMNTGHDGSMTTTHANDPDGAVERIVNLIGQQGDFPPERALPLIAGGLDFIVQVERYEDGSRRVASISEVPTQIQTEGRLVKLTPIPIYEFVQDGMNVTEDGDRIFGHYEKRNDISASVIRKHRLDKKKDLTYEDIVRVAHLV